MFGIELTTWIQATMETLGYPGIGLLLLIETVFPPVPSEIILPLSGFLASQGKFHVLLLIAAATAGSVAGALILYTIGRAFSLARLRDIFDRHGRYALLNQGDLDRAVIWFERHARWAVLVGRCVPVVRSLVSIPAGLSGMPLPRFIMFTAIGSAAWNTALIGAGWLLGSQWERASGYTEIVEYAVIAVILVAAVWFVGKRLTFRTSAE